MSYGDLAFAIIAVIVAIALLRQLHTRPGDLDAARRLAEERSLSVESIKRYSGLFWFAPPRLVWSAPFTISNLSRIYVVIGLASNGQRRKLWVGTDPLGTGGEIKVIQEEPA